MNSKKFRNSKKSELSGNTPDNTIDQEKVAEYARCFDNGLEEDTIVSVWTETVYSREFINQIIKYTENSLGSTAKGIYNVIDTIKGKTMLRCYYHADDIKNLPLIDCYEFASVADAKAFINQMEQIPLNKYHPENDKAIRAKAVEIAQKYINENYMDR